VKASEVIKIARKRSRDASNVALRVSASASLRGELPEKLSTEVP
jgi:hypothetical protein